MSVILSSHPALIIWHVSYAPCQEGSDRSSTAFLSSIIVIHPLSSGMYRFPAPASCSNGALLCEQDIKVQHVTLPAVCEQGIKVHNVMLLAICLPTQPVMWIQG